MLESPSVCAGALAKRCAGDPTLSAFKQTVDLEEPYVSTTPQRTHDEGPQGRLHHEHSSLGRPEVLIDTRVEWVDTDASGHHHNSAVMRWVEAAEAELIRRAWLDDYFPAAPRVHQSIDFRAKVTFGQQVRTRLWIERIGKTSLTFGFEVLAEPEAEHGRAAEDAQASDACGDRVCAARGQLVTAHVDHGSTAASPWPQAWRDALMPYSRQKDQSTRARPESSDS